MRKKQRATFRIAKCSLQKYRSTYVCSEPLKFKYKLQNGTQHINIDHTYISLTYKERRYGEGRLTGSLLSTGVNGLVGYTDPCFDIFESKL